VEENKEKEKKNRGAEESRMLCLNHYRFTIMLYLRTYTDGMGNVM
jgi:hypothetical protein